MHLLSPLIFGISASLDALFVGVSYGIRKVPISWRHNLIISSAALVSTYLSTLVGYRILPLLPSFFYDSFGSVILILLGIYYVVKWLRNNKQTADLTTASEHSAFTGTEILVLSISLSANNIGIGLSAGIAGIHLWPAALSTFLFSAIFLYFGNRMGKTCLFRLPGTTADPLSGLLLFGLGILQFL